MPITWSRLHELLALTAPRPLTIEDITRAIALNLDEDEALDFKAQLRTDEHAKAELAKDVAAMANSGGGLIVYGIGEAPGDKHLIDSPIPLSAEPEQPIHQLLAARVRPLIRPVIEPIRTADGSDGYLLVQVPDSSDSPHFYEHSPDPKNPPGAPIRYGSNTLMMRERDIERAYRDRFVRQEDTATALATLTDDVTRILDFNQPLTTHWLVVVARPTGSVPLGSPTPGLYDCRDIFHQARAASRRLLRHGEGAHEVESLELANPRRGLRRWTARAYADQDAVTVASPYAELHHDGGVVLAYPVTARRAEDDTDTRPAIHAWKVERVAAAGVAVTRTWHSALAITPGAVLRATVVTGSRDVPPFHLFGNAGDAVVRFPGVPSWTHPVRTITPVLVDQVGVDHQAQQQAAVDLAQGVLHQFGSGRLEALAPPDED